MFDFFKYMADTARGIDVEEQERIRKAQLAEERKNKIIFTKKSKRTVYILGVIYLLLAIPSIVFFVKSGSGIQSMASYIVLSLIDIATMTLISIPKFKTELSAAIGMVLFVLMMFVFM